ncbi:MAG TPA: hypothetical protein VEX86_20625 [Longimicrobium sp.]|nr:hypothetical protein [Longimicrobium sp.]
MRYGRQVSALAALGLVAVTGALAPAGEPRRVSGHYTVRWEEQSFTPCGGTEKWWMSDPGPLMSRYRELVKEGDYGTVYATVQAEVTGRGMFGHLGMFPRAMAVREVIDAREPGPNDCREREAE